MRRRLVTLGAALVAVLDTVACQPELEKQSQLLDRVRLLALRADPPEADLRDAGLPPPITFTPLAYPDAGLVFRLSLCGPGNPFAADFDCPGSNGLDLPDLVLDASQPEVQAFLQAAFGRVGGLDGGINVGEPGVAQIAIGYQLERPDAGADPSNRERGISSLSFDSRADDNGASRYRSDQSSLGDNGDRTIERRPSHDSIGENDAVCILDRRSRLARAEGKDAGRRQRNSDRLDSRSDDSWGCRHRDRLACRTAF